MRTSGFSIFPWIGGKTKAELVKWLYPKIPLGKSYVEPFFGSGGVFFNRSPSRIEVINDFDMELISFFRVLQDSEARGKLLSMLEYTPYARQAHQEALVVLASDKEQSPIRRAWAFFVKQSQSFSGHGASWGYSIGVSDGRNDKYPPKSFSRRVDALPFFISRLKNAQIECLPAIEVIKKYGNENSVIYCDPPYVMESRKGDNIYKHEMAEEDHKELLETLIKSPSAVCLSGYPSDLYCDYLAGWQVDYLSVDCYLQRGAINGVRQSKEARLRVECLWRNRRTMDYFAQKTFFEEVCYDRNAEDVAEVD